MYPNYRFYCCNDVNKIFGSIVIHIKDSGLNLDKLKILKKNNNILIYDVLDDVYLKDHCIPDYNKNNYINYVDYFIVNNKFMYDEIINKYKKNVF